MAAKQIADAGVDTRQRERNGVKISTDAPPSSSQLPPQKITPRSSAMPVCDGSLSLHRSKEAPSSSFSKYRLNSMTLPVVTRPSDVGNRRFSHNTASSTNRMAANGLFADHSLSQQNPQLSQRPRQMAKALHPISSEDRTASLDRTSDVSLKPITSPSSRENRRSSSEKPSMALTSPNSCKSLSSKPTRAFGEIENLRHNDKLKGHTDAKDPIAKIKRPAEMLCKDCKTSAMAPVCFINNDGKISAGVMHRFHYCKKPECAANRKSFQPRVSNLRKAAIVNSHSPRMIARHPAKNESRNISNNESYDFAKPGVYCPSVCSDISSARGSDDNGESQDATQINEASMNLRSFENGDVRQTGNILSSNGVSHHHQTEQPNDTSPNGEGKVVLDGLPHNENLQCLSSSRIEGNLLTGGGLAVNDVEIITPTAISCTSSDISNPHEGQDDNHNLPSDISDPHEGEDANHNLPSDISDPHEGEDDNHNLSSVAQEAIDELHGFKAYSYQGDNEYSCSEDGTDATITPISSSRGAFDDPLAHDGEKHLESLVQRPEGGPSMARMRQRYLESLGGQEAETVRLRRQEMMARKQAGDWMLDCHMEELMHRLAPDGEARVKALVEAFESVIHHSDSETSQTHHQEHPLQIHGEQEELRLENIHSDASF